MGRKSTNPVHEHPSIHCYKTWGAKGDCGIEHDHNACREMTIAWQRGARARKRHEADAEARGRPSDTQRKNPLDEDELMRLRRAVGLI